MKSFIVTFVTTVFIFSLLTAPCYAGQLDLFKQPCSSVSKWPKIPMPAMQHVVTGVTGIGAAGIAFDGWKNEKQRVKLMVSGVAGGAISALVAHHLLKCDLLPSVTSGVMAGLLLHRVLAKQEVQKDQDGDVDDSKKQEEVIDEENGQDLSGGVGNLPHENIGFDCSSNSRGNLLCLEGSVEPSDEVNSNDPFSASELYCPEDSPLSNSATKNEVVVVDQETEESNNSDSELYSDEFPGEEDANQENVLFFSEKTSELIDESVSQDQEVVEQDDNNVSVKTLLGFCENSVVAQSETQANNSDDKEEEPVESLPAAQDEKQERDDSLVGYSVINNTGSDIPLRLTVVDDSGNQIKSTDGVTVYIYSGLAYSVFLPQHLRAYQEKTPVTFMITIDGQNIVYTTDNGGKIPAPGSTFVITKEGGWLSSPYKVEVHPPKN